MTLKTTVPTKETGNAITIATHPSLPPRLIEFAAIERIDPKLLIGSGSPDAPAQTLALLESDGYSDPEAMFKAFFAMHGGKKYANKAELADSGTTFSITRIVQRISPFANAERFANDDDDWGLEIVTEDGEPMVLSLSYNENRDAFLWQLAAVIRKAGTGTPPMRLASYETKAGNTFYALEPVRVVAPKPVRPTAITYESEK